MTPRLHRCLPAALPTLLAVVALSSTAEAAEPQLAHMVFFTLKDHSSAARERFLASCRTYLTGHEGAVAFSVGTIAEDVEEPSVSVRDFDVALHVIFASKAAEQKYLEHPRHKRFVEENKASFAKVRVFDTYLASQE